MSKRLFSWLATLFWWAHCRHYALDWNGFDTGKADHDGQYEHCEYLICRLTWWLENWLWYGGKAVV